MTVTTTTPPGGASGERPDGTVTITIDGFELHVPKGTLVIRAAELLGIQIPRFCDHPLLDPIGACRQCIVEIEGQRKPQTACTTPVADGMVVRTQLTSQVADKAQQGTMELLLINHPLDCPVCDKGGECPLQNQAMSNGRADSRFRDEKRTFPKPIAISSQVLLDRERCVLCARCTRFSQQIAGDPFIELFERGALEQVAIYEDEPFESYFSGNTVQICPVGALTGAQYRFRARPFDLQSTPSVCEHCSSGCAQRADWRRGKVMRRLAGDDPQVNEEWNCDKGRWGFAYATAADRITTPLVRDDEGYLVEASWTEALERAATGLRAAVGRAGVLPGGRLTFEDAYAYAKFARTALRTNDVDFRARPHSSEEAEFLAARVAGRTATTYADLDTAPIVLLVAFEPEEESPIVFLRLRKAATKDTRVAAIGPMTTNGARKLGATLLKTIPGGESQVLAALTQPTGVDKAGDDIVRLLREPGAVILLGERLASVPGGFSAAARLADATGAQLAWVPRRAGDRGALDAGLLPGLLPGGHALSDASALGWTGVPTQAGRELSAIVEAARSGGIDALVVGAVDPDDLPDPQAAIDALETVPFLVSLEIRESAVTARADVVLPVAAAVEKAGSYIDWEGRVRPFPETLLATGALPDGRVLHVLAEEMGVDLGLPDFEAARAELERIGRAPGTPAAAPSHEAARTQQPERGQAILATWHLLLDAGRLQDGEPHLAGTAKQATAVLNASTAAEVGVVAGQQVNVATDRGSISLPVAIGDLPDRVVWLPTNSVGSAVRRDLNADAGALVRLSAGGAR
ncbi:MAG: NADH-quinone oxidoreductase subunit [Frankiales bacterium]|jgi:NADH-quinone oxidoreductase subunit G|nr:NADH-quinone oxidoreductase subunit [Frankiales bacterium]